MKIKSIFALLLTAGLMAVSCSKSKDNATLSAEATWLNAQLSTDAATAATVVEKCTAFYGNDGVMTVDIVFGENGLSASQLKPELIDFGVACYLKDMPEAHMADMLNNLSEVEGSLKIKATDAAGDTISHDIPAMKLKQLYRKNYSELGFSAAKSALSDILGASADALAQQVNATSCSFSTSRGFAEYTLTFPRATAYTQVTQGSLAGRYLPALHQKYLQMGNFEAYAQTVCKRLGIDGYRYIYEAAEGDRTVRAALTWDMINSYQATQASE